MVFNQIIKFYSYVCVCECIEMCVYKIYFVAVQLLSRVWLLEIPCTVACGGPLPATPSLSLLEFISIESVILCNHLILRHPLSFCIRVFSSFPASGFFPVSQMFASRGQSIGASPSASVLPMDIQGWLPLGWTGLMCLQSKGNSVIQPCPLHHFWCYALMMTVGEKLGQGRKHTHTHQ